MRTVCACGVVFAISANLLGTVSAAPPAALAMHASRPSGRSSETCTIRNVLQAGEAPVVELLDGGVPIDESDVVATLGTVLRSGGFRPEVAAEVQSRYFGYMIDRQQRDGRWEFVGPLQAYSARYGSRSTSGWPDRTSFLYEDSRANAAQVAPVRPASDVPETANLRIFHRPDRVGFEGGRYQTRDVLMMVYLDPDSGRQSTYAFRPAGESYDLYRYAPARIPLRPTDASLVSVMGVATTETIRVQVFIASVSVPVPRNTYSARLFRAFGGRNYDGTQAPMGPPVRFAGLSQQEGNAPFAAALEAYRADRPLTDKEFADVHRFLRHVHRYLVEEPAGE